MNTCTVKLSLIADETYSCLKLALYDGELVQNNILAIHDVANNNDNIMDEFINLKKLNIDEWDEGTKHINIDGYTTVLTICSKNGWLK